jgi:hypothetical protein
MWATLSHSFGNVRRQFSLVTEPVDGVVAIDSSNSVIQVVLRLLLEGKPGLKSCHVRQISLFLAALTGMFKMAKM